MILDLTMCRVPRVKQRKKPVTFFLGTLEGGREFLPGFCPATALPHCPWLPAPPLSVLSVPSTSTCPTRRAGRGYLFYPVLFPAPRTVPDRRNSG